MDPDNTVYEAMAVEDGRIVRLGTTKELMEEMAPDQELEDLKGCPVLPGMCDCHVHMAVSYTHLDVYKRQLEGRAVRGREP